MSLLTKFLGNTPRLGRRLTTAAHTAPLGLEKASGAASNLVGPIDAGKLLDAANQAVRENLGYIWKAGGVIAVTALGLGLQIYRMEAKINNVEKGLTEKIHNLEIKLKDELHGQLGQMRGELSNKLLAMDNTLIAYAYQYGEK